MKEIKENTYKGTRILIGNEKRNMINRMIDILVKQGYTEIQIPILQFRSTYDGKIGDNIRYDLQDRGGRDLCLAPEYTNIIKELKDTFKYQKDVKLFYVQECFRGEKPQAGRYRQFTQLGVEIINPTKDYMDDLQELAMELLGGGEYELNTDVSRGQNYYKGGKGFEIEDITLGAQKQICGGGEYENGLGFAIGIDRILEVE